MGEKALVDIEGKIDEIEIPEKVDAASVKAAIKVMLPVMKMHGEAIGQSMRDAQEESLEKLAKALEAGRPINKAWDDEPDYGKGGTPHSVVGGDTIINETEQKQVMSLFFKSFRGKDVSAEKALAYVKDGNNGASRRVRELTEKAMSEAVMSQGGIFVPETIRSRIRVLKDEALIIRQIAPEALRIRGGMTIPQESTLATAYWEDENEEIQVTSFEHAFQTLTLNKLTAMIVASNELLKDATNFDRKIEQHLSRAFQRKLEPTYLYGDGTQAQPKGLRNLCAAGNIFAHSGNGGTVTIQTITNDLIEAKARVKSAEHSVGANGDYYAFNTAIWAGLMKKLSTTYEMAPFAVELKAGRLMGTPYFESNHMSSTLDDGTHSEVFYGVRGYINLYEGEDISLDVSRDASYRDEQGVVKSAFAHDQTVFRLIGRESIGLEYPDGMSIITDIETDGSVNAWG